MAPHRAEAAARLIATSTFNRPSFFDFPYLRRGTDGNRIARRQPHDEEFFAMLEIAPTRCARARLSAAMKNGNFHGDWTGVWQKAEAPLTLILSR